MPEKNNMELLKTYSILSDITLMSVDIGKLHIEISDGSVTTGLASLNKNDDVLEIWGDTIVDSAGLDTLVADHNSYSIDEHKTARRLEVDTKSSTLITAQGFVYDGETFSLSLSAQSNWSNLFTHPDKFTWPREISTQCGGYYELAEADVEAFWTAAKDIVDGVLASGRVLRKQINEGTTESEIDAIVDART